jgi:hypothetical protein
LKHRPGTTQNAVPTLQREGEVVPGAAARKEMAARAMMAAFRPLANFCAEYQISTPEAESLLRSVLVHGIFRREQERKKHSKVSVSRVALLAGLHRNEIKRILEVPPRIDPEREARRHRAQRVLSAWQDDPKYLTREGQPKILPLHSKSSARLSFWGLSKEHAPGVWPSLVLDELIRRKAVERLADDRLQISAHTASSASFEHETIDEIEERMQDLLHTLIYNTAAPAVPRLCSTALTLTCDPKWLPVLRNKLERRTRAFLAAVSEDLNSSRTQSLSETEPPARMGLTVYSFENAPALEGNGEHHKKQGQKKGRRQKG